MELAAKGHAQALRRAALLRALRAASRCAAVRAVLEAHHVDHESVEIEWSLHSTGPSSNPAVFGLRRGCELFPSTGQAAGRLGRHHSVPLPKGVCLLAIGPERGVTGAASLSG
jgi:hypothetical protein